MVLGVGGAYQKSKDININTEEIEIMKVKSKWSIHTGASWLKVAIQNFPYYNFTRLNGEWRVFPTSKFIFFGRTWHCLYWDNPEGKQGGYPQAQPFKHYK